MEQHLEQTQKIRERTKAPVAAKVEEAVRDRPARLVSELAWPPRHSPPSPEPPPLAAPGRLAAAASATEPESSKAR